MRTALSIEWVKFRRSMVGKLATALAVFATPLFSLGMVAVARSGSFKGPNAEKFAPLREGTLNQAHVQTAGRILPVVTVIASGFVAAWLFGREYSDRTIGAMFALPISLRGIGLAKVLIAAIWSTLCVVTSTSLTVAGSALLDHNGMSAEVWHQTGVVLGGSIIMGLLGLPFGWVAVATRGYLGGVGAIIGVTAISQILASLGVGPWVPYVGPALWAGAGGSDAASGIGPLHLASAVLAAGVGAAAAISRISRTQLE